MESTHTPTEEDPVRFRDGFASDEAAGRSGAARRRGYHYRFKAAAVATLRRYERNSARIFAESAETPLHHACMVVGTTKSNLSKWAKDEAYMNQEAAKEVTGALMKKRRKNAWFPRKTKRSTGFASRSGRRRVGCRRW